VNHSPSPFERLSRERRLGIVIVLNLAIVASQAVTGVIAGSLGLLADAGHNLADVAAIALSWWAIRLSRRPPTASRSFGWHRSTVLAAQANAAAILAVTALITFEAIRRLGDSSDVRGGIVMVSALVALAGNGFSVLLLRDSHHDLNMRSALLHMLGDVGASAGVALAGFVILVTDGNYWVDPVVSLAVGLLISVEAVRLLRATTDVLLEATPANLDLSVLVEAVAADPNVDDVHDVHAWALSSDVHALSAHVVMTGHPTLEEAQVVGDRLKRLLAERFRIAHATLELECEPCMDDDRDPCAMDGLTPSLEHRHSH
jgi:cobalt-zinc-cadmium efflux system protein